MWLRAGDVELTVCRSRRHRRSLLIMLASAAGDEEGGEDAVEGMEARVRRSR